MKLDSADLFLEVPSFVESGHQDNEKAALGPDFGAASTSKKFKKEQKLKVTRSAPVPFDPKVLKDSPALPLSEQAGKKHGKRKQLNESRVHDVNLKRRKLKEANVSPRSSTVKPSRASSGNGSQSGRLNTVQGGIAGADDGGKLENDEIEKADHVNSEKLIKKKTLQEKRLEALQIKLGKGNDVMSKDASPDYKLQSKGSNSKERKHKTEIRDKGIEGHANQGGVSNKVAGKSKTKGESLVMKGSTVRGANMNLELPNSERKGITDGSTKLNLEGAATSLKQKKSGKFKRKSTLAAASQSEIHGTRLESLNEAEEKVDDEKTDAKSISFRKRRMINECLEKLQKKPSEEDKQRNDTTESVVQGKKVLNLHLLKGSQDKASQHEVGNFKIEVQAATATGKKGRPSVLDKMRAQLQGGRFRMLNEKLYTCRGEDAFGFFSKDPGSFYQYHTGYNEQTASWPRLPIDVIIKWVKGQGPELTIADFGCGDAKLAANVPNRVFSLDLVASHPSVIACNMAKTPLDSQSVGAAVFCLSLMGIDYSKYLIEARRVLKPRGWLIIAEVKSRFDPANGGADPADFVMALAKLGFESHLQDSSNKMFLMFFFRKGKERGPMDKKSLQTIDWPVLKACIYKRR